MLTTYLNHVVFLCVTGLEEEDIMAQVMALSQQEYLDSLKQRAAPSTSTNPPSATITTRDLPGTSTDLPGALADFASTDVSQAYSYTNS